MVVPEAQATALLPLPPAMPALSAAFRGWGLCLEGCAHCDNKCQLTEKPFPAHLHVCLTSVSEKQAISDVCPFMGSSATSFAPRLSLLLEACLTFFHHNMGTHIYIHTHTHIYI